LIILTEGSADEYKAALEGNNADFGRYTVDEPDRSITFHMDHASHKELEGTSHKRYFSLNGGQLKYTTSRVPADGKAKDVYGEVVLERSE
jgi:Lipocalin-like domain